MKFNKLIICLIAFISIFSLNQSITSASSQNDDRHVIMSVKYPEEKNIDKLVQLALKQRGNSLNDFTNRTSETSNSLRALQLLQEESYSDGSVDRYYALTALTTIPGSSSKSSGKYDISASVTMYYTITGTAPYYSDAKTTVDRVTATINDIGSDSRYVSTLEMFYHGFKDPQTPQVDRYSTTTNPSNGTYTLYANDNNEYSGGIFTTVNGGAILTFSDNTQLGTNYELTVVL